MSDDYEFVPLNMDWAKAKTEKPQREHNDDDVRFVFMPKGAGEIKFRVLPPNRDGRLGMFIYKHWNIPFINDKGELKTFAPICVRETFPDKHLRCPVCDMIEELKKNGITEEDYGDYVESCKSYIGALITSGKDHEGDPIDPYEPIMFGMNEYSLKWILEMAMDPDMSNFYNPYAGGIIRFKRDAPDAKWDRDLLPGNFTPIHPDKDEVKNILAKAPDPYQYWTVPDEKMMERIVDGANKIKESIYVSRNMAEKLLDENRNPQKAVAQANEKAREAVAEKKAEAPAVTPEIKKVEVKPAETARTVEDIQKENKDQLATSRPAGAPVCYGDPKVYDDETAKCLGCPHALACGEVVDSGGATPLDRAVDKADDTPF